MKMITKLAAFSLSISMFLTMAACGSGDKSSESTKAEITSAAVEASTNASAPVKETYNVRILLKGVETTYGNYPDNPIAKEILKRTGTTMEFVKADADKYKIILAGGDLPDVVVAAPDVFKQLIEGGNIIPMDDLLNTNGQDIIKTIPTTLEFSKKFWSEKQNKTYFLPVNIGTDGMGMEASIGATVRWDYYKELGYPSIGNEDDLLKVLSDMQKLHPTTDDGKKVYGVSAWSDWGAWPFYLPMAALYGYNNWGSYGYVYNSVTNEMTNDYTNQDSPLWKTTKYYYKANKMGLLDPDALTQKNADFQAKCANGQLLSAPASWATGDFTARNSKDAKGFMTLPMEWGNQWNGAEYPCGWFDKGYAISVNAKKPDRVMDLLNLLWSYDGARLLYSGVQGENWDIVNGKPEMKDETVQLRTKGGDDWLKTQIGDSQLLNVIGLSPSTINPADGMPVSLFNTEKVYTAALTPLQKDFSEHYNVKYPAQIFLNNVAAGKSKNQSQMNVLIPAAIPSSPDDIKKIDAKCDEYMLKAIAKCILSKSDAEFEANMKKAIEDVKAMGNDTAFAWWNQAWTDAKTAVGAK